MTESVSPLEKRLQKILAGENVEACYEMEFARALATHDRKSEVLAVFARLREKFRQRFGQRRLEQLIEEATEEIRAAAGAERSQRYILNEDGNIIPNLANAITMLSALPVAWNSFSCRTFLKDKSPWETNGNWTGYDDLKAAEWCQHNGLNIKKETAADAVEAIAMSRPHISPVADYLRGLKWDKTPRLDRWLETYLGVEDDENGYVRAVAAKWMMSAVDRALNPGCQADYTLVLEGNQGRKKSSALRALTGFDWFTDDLGEDIGKKDSGGNLQGKWVIEVAELDAFHRAEMTTIKAWLVRRVDHFRPAYARRAEDFPRQNVFAASTNKTNWLNDDTGGRRFWPVTVGATIKVDELARDRDQLWAEATERFLAGEQTWFDQHTEFTANAEQAQRQEIDPWKEAVEDWLKNPGGSLDLRSKPEKIYLPEILRWCLGIEVKSHLPIHRIRVARILKLARYKSERTRKSDADEDGRRPEYWIPE